jgi:hypothetical protein
MMMMLEIQDSRLEMTEIAHDRHTQARTLFLNVQISDFKGTECRTGRRTQIRT